MRLGLQAGETRGLLRYKRTQAWLGAVPGKLMVPTRPWSQHRVPEVMPQPATGIIRRGAYPMGTRALPGVETAFLGRQLARALVIIFKIRTKKYTVQ